MITGKDRERSGLVQNAVRDFLDQTYENCELVIINDGEVAVDCPYPSVREMRLPSEKKTLGELRNLGIAAARGDWVIQWDDDDIHHPERIARQMASRQGELPVLLGGVIHYHSHHGSGFWREWKVGFPGSILHPRATENRYPHQASGEDTAFIDKFSGRVVLECDDPLYIYCFHGANTYGETHVMCGQMLAEGELRLSGHQRQELERKVMERASKM